MISTAKEPGYYWRVRIVARGLDHPVPLRSRLADVCCASRSLQHYVFSDARQIQTSSECLKLEFGIAGKRVGFVL